MSMSRNPVKEDNLNSAKPRENFSHEKARELKAAKLGFRDNSTTKLFASSVKPYKPPVIEIKRDSIKVEES